MWDHSASPSLHYSYLLEATLAVCYPILYSGSQMMLWKSIRKRLLACMQTTIGSCMKLLLVWGQMTRTVSLCSLSLPSTLSGKNFVSLRDIRGESRDWSQFPRSRVFAFSSRWSSFLSYGDDEAHLSLSSPMHRKLGASYSYCKCSITPLLYSWLTVMKSACALGPFLNQY